MFASAVKQLGIQHIGHLGQGAQGEVLSGWIDKQEVAVKCSHNTSATRMEAALWKTLQHPNITPVFEVHQTTHHVFIVQEKMYQDLMSVLEKQTKLSEKQTRSLFMQVCKAVEYCHNQGLAHMDIKPENIVVDENASTAKLCDFGTAKKFEPGHGVPCNVGTVFYTAPEIVRAKFGFPDKGDIWALGILLHVMMTGTWPMRGTDAMGIDLTGGIMLHDSVTSDPKLYSLLNSLLHYDPSCRPTVRQILRHPWFRASRRISWRLSATLSASLELSPRTTVQTNPQRYPMSKQTSVPDVTVRNPELNLIKRPRVDSSTKQNSTSSPSAKKPKFLTRMKAKFSSSFKH